MTQPACLNALLLAAGTSAIARPCPGLTIRPWSQRTRARMLRAATALVLGSLAVALALALSLVGVNGGAADWSPTIRVAMLGSIAIAALLIRGGRGSGAEWR